jgi:multidrug efflux pump subunit AcrA (membrane-fusion protein)
LDLVSRTVPVVFEVENTDALLKLGSAVSVQLVTQSTVEAVAIPRAAVVDEDGILVAYVQVDGEAFERRQLTLGIREGDWIEVTEGLTPGERVVTRGAYLIRLAASSSTIPAHGHAH